MRVLGILLAGGQGTRLGAGVPKAAVALDGVTLLERAIATLSDLCASVSVVAPAGMALPDFPEGRVPVDRADDPPGDNGPLGALVAATDKAICVEAFVLGVDMPFVTPSTLRVMDQYFHGFRSLPDGPCACVPAPGGVMQPLVSVLHATAIPRLRHAYEAGERSMSAAMASLNPLVLDDAHLERLPGGVDAFMNVNTPEDLARAEARLRGSAR
jgi:molybdopterin-guanine dinucleotide biosynthesis protein A